MTRLTILGFLLLSGFFYVTGKPIDDSANPELASPFGPNSQSSVSAESTVAPLVVAEAAFAEVRMLPTDAVLIKQAALPELPARNPSRLVGNQVALNSAPNELADAQTAEGNKLEVGANSASGAPVAAGTAVQELPGTIRRAQVSRSRPAARGCSHQA